MPPSSNNSHSRLPRTSEEHRRRQRYSLRIEILDDDELAEIDRAREAGERRDRRRSRETSVARSRENAEPNRPRSSERRSRRVSTSSTAAVVGTQHRGSSTPPGSGQQDASRVSARSHDEGAFPGIFAQIPAQMPAHERPSSRALPRPGSSSGANRRTRNASTQTLFSRYDSNLMSAPASWEDGSPRPPIPRSLGRHDRSLERAYFDGFLMGQRLGRDTPPARPPNLYRRLLRWVGKHDGG
ncbi:hypothetical protein F4821DRAFT_264677 [Hypoxylon rubiginosum]|uniref:Uncharacterized protein n=1 Tax=Hypoxylon rubiginosum TaxID=110542 RepID=A0ACC0CMM9_9PEZI|nr:hypothetical protein F4821DRAFT_264677 [Hypoxylon rubiginosum]